MIQVPTMAIDLNLLWVRLGKGLLKLELFLKNEALMAGVSTR